MSGDLDVIPNGSSACFRHLLLQARRWSLRPQTTAPGLHFKELKEDSLYNSLSSGLRLVLFDTPHSCKYHSSCPCPRILALELQLQPQCERSLQRFTSTPRSFNSRWFVRVRDMKSENVEGVNVHRSPSSSTSSSSSKAQRDLSVAHVLQSTSASFTEEGLRIRT